MLDKYDRKILTLIHKLPACSQPYQVVAEQVGLSEEEVLERIKGYIQQGFIRRMGITVNHFLTGFKANAMVAWRVKAQDVDRVGEMLSALPCITHCYERGVDVDWEYNIFAMFHARTRQELEQTVEEIAGEMGVSDYKILYTLKEWKKDGRKYL
ncbi:MAG: AsnC family transcriptional regulator [Candidatus Desantisbacteria bacterium]